MGIKGRTRQHCNPSVGCGARRAALARALKEIQPRRMSSWQGQAQEFCIEPG
jgi:hypothetical protein